MRPSLSTTLALALAALAGGTGRAQTPYDYGSSGYGLGDSRFQVFLELGTANPRNADNVVAAVGPNVIIPVWDDDVAGRLGVGYRLFEGVQLTASAWSFETEQDAAGSGTTFQLPIGPTQGTAFNVTTEIQASLADVAFSFTQEVSEAFSAEWSAGLRLASFEETTSGTYNAPGTVAVAKSLEGDMLGARVGGRAIYRVRWFSASGGLGLSLLDGEIDASQSLTPPTGTTALGLTDDSRSGSILDVDVRAAWHASSERLAVWLGWEQQVWDDIAADLARNLPGSGVITRDRDSVTFSWLKAGVSFSF